MVFNLHFSTFWTARDSCAVNILHAIGDWLLFFVDRQMSGITFEDLLNHHCLRQLYTDDHNPSSTNAMSFATTITVALKPSRFSSNCYSEGLPVLTVGENRTIPMPLCLAHLQGA
ncbi:hypothetical protein KCU99_g85, partial [Aureobasidium melanogenum]